MKQSLIASALLISASLIPTGAFANYYTYERCINAGGSFFSCMGELLWDDGEIAPPDDVQEQFGFVKNYGEDRIMESVQFVSKKCDETKGKERMACYQEGLKSKLMEK